MFRKGKRVKAQYKRRSRRDLVYTLVIYAGCVIGIVAAIAMSVRPHGSAPVADVQEKPVEVNTSSIEDNKADKLEEDFWNKQFVSNPYNKQYADDGHEYPRILYSMDWDDEDNYLLAKIIECEAGICDMRTKVMHGLVVLNRVQSNQFPDTIEEVITQNNGRVYQFSPVAPNGSWWYTEPSDESLEAVDYLRTMEYNIADGAMYFEAAVGSTWHERNLQFITESDGVRFYKEW